MVIESADGSLERSLGEGVDVFLPDGGVRQVVDRDCDLVRMGVSSHSAHRLGKDCKSSKVCRGEESARVANQREQSG